MNKQRISIIIPVYNSEKYLDTCLNSLINQTFKDIEIICINDGSMDNSLNILEKYAQTDKRIIVINQENSGVAVARNKGLKTATGNYVMFCDSDDYYHTDMCKTMLNKLTKENVDTVMCSANVFSDFKSTRDLKMVQEQYDNKDHLCSLNDWKNKLLLRNELWNKIFKKEIIDKYHICFPEKIWCDDRAFIMKYLACSDNVFVLKDRLYNYRLTPKSYCENVHNKKYKNFYDTIFAMQDVKRFFTQNELMEKNKYYFADKINFSLFAYYGTCDKAHKKDFILKHKELITDLEFDEDFLENYPVINSLKKKGWKNTLNLLEKKENLSLLETIFSIKNRDIHKIITICGIKLKLRNKTLIKEKQKQAFIEYKFKNLENSIFDKLSSMKEDFNTFTGLSSKSIQKQNEELFKGMIFNNLIQNKDWIKNKEFIPTKGAATYSFLYILLIILDKIQPENILEFGLGQTTKLTTQYAKFKNPNCFLQTIDHDENWINAMIAELPVSENINIIKRDLETFTLNNTKNDKYHNLQEVTKDTKYDLIIIDGPFGFNRTYPRTNILDLIPQNLAQDFVIILDDAERDGEQNTAKLIFEKLDENNIKYSKFYQHASKSQLIITSDKYKFISFY